jgi:hypothetical protein
MHGSVIASLLQTKPLELALRVALAFGIALWLFTRLGPALLEALLPWYEQAVHRLDDRYRIDLTLSHQTGHDKIGSDLVVLGRATVARTFVVFGADRPIILQPGSVLTCSTATGLLLQPAVMLLGLLLGWPTRSAGEALIRFASGSIMLAAWLLLGIPFSLWIYFHDIPIRAYAPDELAFLTIAGKFLLNGGSLVLGAMLAACALALAYRWTVPPPEPERSPP